MANLSILDLFTSEPAQSVPFNFGTHAVRVIMRDGNPWFVAADVCATLGYKNTSDAVATHLDDDEKGVAIGYTLGGDQTLTIINESGLYALVLRSRKPEARKFAKWVTSEVLPTIRKTGEYAMGYRASVDFAKVKAITQATRLFHSTQRAHAGLSIRQSYLLAVSAAQEATGVDLLAVWKLDPATLSDVSVQAAAARSPKKDGKQLLLEKLMRYIKAARPIARHQDMLKRMHLYASDFQNLVDDAVANGLLLRKSGVEYNYAGTVYVLAGSAA